MNHVLPFRESPSTGITGFTVFTKHSTTKKKLLIFQVRDIVSFAHRIGTIPYVPWQDWLHFATQIELPLVSPYICILHSHVLELCGTASSTDLKPILRVWDFSLRSRRLQAQDDPSAQFPPYTMREPLLDAKCHRPTFQIMEGGVLFTHVRIHAIVRHAEVLTRCTSRIQLTEDWNGTFGLLRTSNTITTRAPDFQLYFHAINPSSSFHHPTGLCSYRQLPSAV
jgi:hypothetical protein